MMEECAMNDSQYERSVELLKKHGQISASVIQRHLGIGYPDAEEVLEKLKQRECLVQGLTSLTWVCPGR